MKSMLLPLSLLAVVAVVVVAAAVAVDDLVLDLFSAETFLVLSPSLQKL